MPGSVDPAAAFLRRWPRTSSWRPTTMFPRVGRRSRPPALAVAAAACRSFRTTRLSPGSAWS